MEMSAAFFYTQNGKTMKEEPGLTTRHMKKKNYMKKSLRLLQVLIYRPIVFKL